MIRFGPRWSGWPAPATATHANDIKRRRCRLPSTKPRLLDIPRTAENRNPGRRHNPVSPRDESSSASIPIDDPPGLPRKRPIAAEGMKRRCVRSKDGPAPFAHRKLNCLFNHLSIVRSTVCGNGRCRGVDRAVRTCGNSSNAALVGTAQGIGAAHPNPRVPFADQLTNRLATPSPRHRQTSAAADRATANPVLVGRPAP